MVNISGRGRVFTLYFVHDIYIWSMYREQAWERVEIACGWIWEGGWGRAGGSGEGRIEERGHSGY